MFTQFRRDTGFIFMPWNWHDHLSYANWQTFDFYTELAKVWLLHQINKALNYFQSLQLKLSPLSFNELALFYIMWPKI